VIVMTRAAFFRVHSWLGIVTGVGLLLVAWTGSLVVFNDEIEWVLDPAVRADPARGQATLNDVVAAIQQRHPGRRLELHPQIGTHWVHVAYVYEGRAQRMLLIDPATAAIRRDDVMDGYTFSYSYFLRQLHVRLLLGYWGRVLVGAFGVTLLLSVLTSLRIYREWFRSLSRLRRSEGRRIFHMDLHKAVGLWSLLFNVLFAVTGAVLGLENLYYRIWPPPLSEIRVALPPPSHTLPAPLTPDTLVAGLSRIDPAFRPTAIDVLPEGTLVVHGDHPGVLAAEGASRYEASVDTGVVMAWRDARREPWPGYLYNLLDPLHFGYFGERWGVAAGYAVELVWFLAGLAPGVLAITGGVMWTIRRGRRASRIAAPL
jgi:uncharacterized iron-regulated membrane protein